MNEMLKNPDEKKDVLEAIEKIKQIQKQKQNPDRNGMITALSDTKNKAPIAITVLELTQGDNRWMPFSNFSDSELYQKLSQYQQGLENYCIDKIGKQLFDELMKK